MTVWLFSHWYLLAGIVIGLVGGFALWRSLSRNQAERSRPLTSYLLVWPLIFEQEGAAKTKTRRTFVIVGVLIMLLLVALSFIVNPGRA
jgi:HAMP domain-containing protein